MAAVVIAPTVNRPPRRIPSRPSALLDDQRARPSAAPVTPRHADRLDPAVYRRRRAAVVVLGVVLLVGAVEVVGLVSGTVSSWQASPGAPTAPDRGSVTGPPPSPVPADASPAEFYIVEPGDTLWSIARRLDPGGDPRPIVDRLAEQSRGVALRPGQRLSLDGVR